MTRLPLYHREVKVEKTHESDLWINDRHRLWGWDRRLSI